MYINILIDNGYSLIKKLINRKLNRDHDLTVVFNAPTEKEKKFLVFPYIKNLSEKISASLNNIRICFVRTPVTICEFDSLLIFHWVEGKRLVYYTWLTNAVEKNYLKLSRSDSERVIRRIPKSELFSGYWTQFVRVWKTA